MNPCLARLPLLVTLTAAGALLWHGPIPQPQAYHDFADRSVLFGLQRAGDVLSNLGFAVVGLWGWVRLRPRRHCAAIRAGWPGYRLFLGGLVLTTIGSVLYHLAPGNDTLALDRLPIALVCAGLLAAVRSETLGSGCCARDAALLALFGVSTVAWWHFTEATGRGDLRPYLLLQFLPLVLIPLWQAIHRAPRSDRTAFGMAIAAYVLAKGAEVLDHAIADRLVWLSGHTLKHLLATLAAGILVWRLVRRVSAQRAGDGVSLGSSRRPLAAD